MAEVLTGTQQGHVIILDADESDLAASTARNGRRVRVVLEPLDEVNNAATQEPAQLLRTWAEKGPQGPIEEPRSTDVPEATDLVLSDEEQRHLLQAWSDSGPQGPLED